MAPSMPLAAYPSRYAGTPSVEKVMAHVETPDPLNMVGSHVVRNLPGGGRRQEHAWLTRYDAKLDAYALLVPGSAPRLVARKEVVQFVTNPSIQVLDGDADGAPPPVEDAGSRFAGVPMVKRSARRRRGGGGELRGKVVCFLPFADKYRVEYSDGSTEDVSESAVVDNMIQQLKSGSQEQEVEIVDIDVIDTRRRKRARADKAASPEVEVVEPPPPPRLRVSPRRAVAEVAREPVVPIETEPSPEEEEEEMQVDDSNNDSFEPIREVEDAAPPDANAAEEQVDERVSILELDDAIGEFVPVDEEDQEEPMPVSAEETAESASAPLSPPRQSKMPFYIIEGLSHTPTEPLDKRATAFEYLRQWLLNLLDRQEAGRKKNLQQYEVLRNPDIKDRDACRRFLEAGGLYVLRDLLKAFMEDNGIEGDEDLLFVLKVIAMLPSPSYEQVMGTEIGQTIGMICKGTLPEDRERPYPRSISHLARWIKRKWIEVIQAKPNESKAKPKTKPSLNTARRSKPMQKRRAYPPVPSNIPRGPSLMLGGTPAQNRMPVESPPRSDPTPIPRRKAPQPPPAISKPSHPFVDHPLPPPPVASFADSRSQRSAPSPSAQGSAASYYPPPPLPNQPPLPPYPPPQEEQPRVNRLKPDWMLRAEAQSLSRVTLQSDTTAERRHYQATQSTHPDPSPAANNASAQAKGKKKEKVSQQAAIAGGPTGVYGRQQKLKFRKQWQVQEFDRNEPPIAVNRNTGYRPGDWSANPNDTFRRYPPPHFINRPKPILRRESRYNAELENLD